ncbi:MAG: hypothetical protein DMG80_09850 [Acidobacteria bacterium]|nr:MAG: hypothetical protein DMG80_09850 [Acidobacteriota bacterium]
MAVRVEGSVAKRKECITPRYKEDSYISGFHSTVDFLFSIKGRLERGESRETAVSSDRVSALLDSLMVLRGKDGRSRASSVQFARLDAAVSGAEVVWGTRKALMQPCRCQGIERAGRAVGLS